MLGPAALHAQVTPVTLQWFETSWNTMEDRTADAFVAGYGRVWTPPVNKGEGGGYSTGYNTFDRFDMGSPGNTTRYGTFAGFQAVIGEQDRANIGTFIDLIVNHNGNTDANNTGFVNAGGYPGFVFSWNGDNDGDYHARWDDCESNPINCRIAGLVDIAQEKNHVMIRHPVVSGDPQNIPAGTVYNRPSASNRQYYPDLALPANSLGIHPFNLADPMAGDPVAENATGLLMRYTRWMLEVVRVDGFRIDAAKHMPDWFLRDFYDRNVFGRGPGGSTPYSFMELYDGSWAYHTGYVCKGGLGNCNTAGGVQGNRDTLDFPLYFKLHDELNGTGFGTWENIIGASVDGIFDGNPNNGNFGVQFVSAHDESLPPPGEDNVAYAYVLMRAGSPVVYFKAGEFGTVNFPRDGRGDALGGQFGDLMTRLVDIHNEYARSDYIERRDSGNPSFQDVLIFERSNTCLVGLNDRVDGGYDQRTVQTYFPAGTRLFELTGNAADATVDPNNDIWDMVTVGSGGWVTIRVPRNKSPAGVWHHKGYVIYGPINPTGTLTLSPVTNTIAADPPSDPNATRRLTPLEVITADSFEVKLETTDADPGGDGEDDLAMLKMDAGMDLNGNGYIDSTDPSFVGYNYENFVTENRTLKNNPVDDGGVLKGCYRQIIDATQLSEGRHYLSVIAFRSRPAGSSPIFQTWRKVILVDRAGAAMALESPAAGTTLTSSFHNFSVRCTDRTANAVHFFLDQQPGTDLVALAQMGQGRANQVDRDQFQLTLSSLTPGNHRLDVVAFEETGRASVSIFAGISVQFSGFDGIGDMNRDNKITNRDIWPFVQMVQAGDQFNYNADCNGDGVVDSADVPIFATKLLGAGSSQKAVDEMAATIQALIDPPGEASDPADADAKEVQP